MGVVEVELPNLDARCFERHAQSYGFWAQGNVLYDDGAGWLSQDEWSAKVQEQLPTGGFGFLPFLDWTWIVILVGLIALVLVAARRTNRQVKQSLSAQDEALAQQRHAMEQQRLSMERQAHAIQLTEQSLAIAARQTEVLGEILEELRKRA